MQGQGIDPVRARCYSTFVLPGVALSWVRIPPSPTKMDGWTSR